MIRSLFAAVFRNFLMTMVFCLSVALPRIGIGQGVEELKQGVTKILASVDGREKTGTGFVVRLDSDAAYIVTASHVVEGDKNPRVAFFANKNMLVRAEVLRLESGNDRGLAVLIVRGKENLPPALAALAIDAATVFRAADQAVAIGFPKGGGDWSVSNAMISGMDGRDFVLSGQIAEGNSGGPLIKQGKVIGVVTQEKQGFGRAVPSQILRSTLEGWGVSSSNDCRVVDGVQAKTIPSKGPSTEAERLFTEAQKLNHATRYAEANKLFRAASELGNFYATINLAVNYWAGHGADKDEAEAIRLFRQVCKAATAGDAFAQFFIGAAYGLPAPWLVLDAKAATRWYTKAADGGHMLAQYNLGTAYSSGRGMVADPALAFKYLGMAATQGYAQAQHNLGMLYINGYGGVPDRKTGIAWLEKAAAQGLPLSKSSLEAIRVEEAALGGNPEAQYHLAQMNFTGKGVKQDTQRAMQLLKSSADQGFAPAQYTMGFRYENGDGVPRSIPKAFYWYTKAAEQGQANAQNNLGVMYMQGKAVPQNFVLAIVWFKLAANQGLDDAKTNLNLTRQLSLSSTEISKINELVRIYSQKLAPPGN